MKKVIDACVINAPLLVDFLKASPQNKAVLTDYLSMESFKDRSEINIRNSLSVIREFSNQVLILKPTCEIALLRPKRKGLQSRFIDERQTQGFDRYCRALFGAQTTHISNDVTSKGAVANAHFAHMLGSVETIKAGISKIMLSYEPEDLKALRAGIPISKDFSNRIVKDIMMTTAIFFRNLGYNRDDMPCVSDVIYAFPFRYAVCSYALALKWIANGAHTTVAPEKLRNDCVDMTYAAYATFFDGFLTTDKKAYELYSLARWMLINVFAQDD